MRISEYPGATLSIHHQKPLIQMPKYDPQVLEHIAEICGDRALYRLINKKFVPTALEHGTDKAFVEHHDFRRIFPWSEVGLDRFDVEACAKEQNRKIDEVICANPLRYFLQEITHFSHKPARFGIPITRLGLLVHVASSFDETPGIRDGYFFRTPQNKRDTLAGGVIFDHPPSELEAALSTAVTIQEKIALIQAEISKRFCGIEYSDEDAHCLGLELSDLLYEESHKQALSPASSGDTHQMHSLAEAVGMLNQKIQIISEIKGNIRSLLTNLRFLQFPEAWDDLDLEDTRARLVRQFIRLKDLAGAEETSPQQKVAIREWLSAYSKNLPPGVIFEKSDSSPAFIGSASPPVDY